MIPGLDVDRLHRLAQAGGGEFALMSADDTDITRLTEHHANAISGKRREIENVSADSWVELGPWLLLPLIPVCALWFRRGLE